MTSLASTTVRKDSMICPRCNSARVVRNGHSHGRQRFLCRGCNRTFGHTTARESGGVRLVEKHAAFLALCSAPMPLRTAAEQVGVALSTVFRWRHAYLERLEREEESQRRNLNGTVASLLTKVCINERWWRRSTSQTPDIACFPAISIGETLAGSIVHLVQCQGGHLIDQICSYGYRTPTRRDLIHVLSKHVVPGTMLVSPFGNGIVEGSSDLQDYESGSTTVKWLVGTRARNLLSDDGTAWEISTARKLANRLRAYFRRWMRAFRGIAVHYVKRYMVWFNACWRHAREKHTPEFCV
jgi:transposase-like protein